MALKQYRVQVQPGDYPMGQSSTSSTADWHDIVVTATDGARAREIAEAQYGGPTKCRASVLGEIR